MTGLGRRRLCRAVVATIVVVLGPFGLAANPSTRAGAAPGPCQAGDVGVSTFSNDYNPDPTVQVGDTVCWTWASSNHSVTADDASFGSGVQPSASTFRITFGSAGTVPYHCTVHGSSGGGGMSGTVTVGAATPTPTITKVKPITRGQGAKLQKLTVTGTGFIASTVVSIAGPGITISPTTFVNATTVFVKATLSATTPVGAHAVTVTNPGKPPATCAACFSATPAPNPTSVAPATGARSTAVPVTIIGSNFKNKPTIKVSGTGVQVSGVTFTDSTHVQATFTIGANAALTARSVTVTNPDKGVATITGAFAVT
jgi:plastocyanin